MIRKSVILVSDVTHPNTNCVHDRKSHSTLLCPKQLCLPPQGAQERGSQTQRKDIPRNEATSIPDIPGGGEDGPGNEADISSHLCSSPKVPKLLLFRTEYVTVMGRTGYKTIMQEAHERESHTLKPGIPAMNPPIRFDCYKALDQARTIKHHRHT